MEERKFDPYQFIGFVLIAMILTWMLYVNKPEEGANPAAEPDKTEVAPQVEQTPPIQLNDSLQKINLQSTFGIFSNWMTDQGAATQRLENKNLLLEISPKGGVLELVRLKDYTDYLDQPLELIKEGNNQFNVQFTTKDGRRLNTKDFYFSPQLSSKNGKQILSLKAAIAPNQYLEFVYAIDTERFLVDFSIQSSGIATLLDSSEPALLSWETRAYRNSKSIDYEGRYTELTYGYEGDKIDYLSLSGTDEESPQQVRWVSFRQHFFSAILIPEKPIDQLTVTTDNLADDKSLNEVFTKKFGLEIPLDFRSGEFDSRFEYYFGITDYQTLKSYDRDLESSIPLGWGIFGWLNRFLFLPLFGFLSSFLPHGIAIILMTIIVRLGMSPVTYKSYVSQIKMKVLRPEIEELNKKYKDNAVKRQQETMSLYNRAGANPMAGCIPALLQLPVFYALFTFFPVAFELRKKSFLWADDLSSYDSILDLGFSIPFYGDHVSLFPILASIAIFFYTQMTTGQQAMPQQPGMPNMKIIMYLMPLMMLFFFNNYASGLSLYYFVSNLLTIFLMLVIKNYIIDDDKIHAKIEENKKKPKKAGGFSARLQKAMEEAEKQKKARGR
ncbi:MAG: membrane protein insertase YidC [Bacteroidetes bacterium]|jgi:YidC/Oxa1 family membrane protein insertase|nr:membrane protein insertase YidC [Flavobacteriaceae bacterium]MBT6128189.1 membrane protein insertase YidC [Flavobacteriaceae bacterium]MDG1940750.1 membrane protein insertase YidC [Flavobacteriaceae bacterium]NCF31789.1 membrane protein insertase YidC [Bacteroidota bacterium]